MRSMTMKIPQRLSNIYRTVLMNRMQGVWKFRESRYTACGPEGSQSGDPQDNSKRAFVVGARL